MDRFEVVKKLGRGSYGSAVAAMRKDTRELVVIKRVDMTEMDESEKKQVRQAAAREQLLFASDTSCRQPRRRLAPFLGRHGLELASPRMAWCQCVGLALALVQCNGARPG